MHSAAGVIHVRGLGNCSMATGSHFASRSHPAVPLQDDVPAGKANTAMKQAMLQLRLSGSEGLSSGFAAGAFLETSS